MKQEVYGNSGTKSRMTTGNRREGGGDGEMATPGGARGASKAAPRYGPIEMYIYQYLDAQRLLAVIAGTNGVAEQKAWLI